MMDIALKTLFMIGTGKHVLRTEQRSISQTVVLSGYEGFSCE